MTVAIPQASLGRVVEGGVSPAILAILDRALLRRPELLLGLRAEIELAMEDYPPVTIAIGEAVVLVEDGPARAPDLRLVGMLPDLVHLLVTPTISGVPNPINRRGRAALGLIAQRRVRFEGNFGVLRQFLAAIRI